MLHVLAPKVLEVLVPKVLGVPGNCEHGLLLWIGPIQRLEVTKVRDRCSGAERIHLVRD